MNSCPVLGEEAVHSLLINLSKPEVVTFQTRLAKALKDFSVGPERDLQPDPSHAKRPNGQKSLYRPFTSEAGVGVKIIVDPAPDPATGKRDRLHGTMVLCDAAGIPSGVISAEELTGYRTSMSAMNGFMWRKRVASVLVFGSGLQALWHTRLMLALRGDEIESITYVNRSLERAEALAARVSGENAQRWKSKCVFACLDTAAADHAAVLGRHLATADAVFCTVPAKAPIFAASPIQARSTSWPYISAIGSWQEDMIELEPELLQHALAYDGQPHPIIVDDSKSVLVHTGEFVRSRIGASQVVEVGRLLAIKDGEAAALEASQAADVDRWLAEGLVVYKSIGVGLTDLTMGEAILSMLKQQGKL